MANTLQTIRSGGTEHPQEIVNAGVSNFINQGGIVGSGSFLVAESDTPAMSVQIATGWAIIYDDADMSYQVHSSGDPYTATIGANASGNDRIDAIVLYIDLAVSPDATVTTVAKIAVVEGTPAGSPVAPDDTAILAEIGASNPYIVLAHVDVANGETEITDAEITDQRERNIGGGVLDVTRQEMFIPAGAFAPTTTGGCADAEIEEMATNDIDVRHIDFDPSSDEYAFANIQMPTDYDGGVIQYQYLWTTINGVAGASETAVMELSGRAFADGDALDQAVGTPIEVEDTWQAEKDLHISPWSGDVTIAGSPAGGQFVVFKLMRDVSEDNCADDVSIIGVKIRYKTNAFSK